MPRKRSLASKEHMETSRDEVYRWKDYFRIEYEQGQI